MIDYAHKPFRRPVRLFINRVIRRVRSALAYRVDSRLPKTWRQGR